MTWPAETEAGSAGTPVVVIRGYGFRPKQAPASRIIRPAREDLFRQ